MVSKRSDNIKSIDTLVQDIENVLSSGVEEIPESLLSNFANNLVETVKTSLTQRVREPTLRMSNIGKPCERQLWYEINQASDGEKLRPETYMKFMIGHMLEEVVLFLAELAGHEVTGRQDTQEIEGIKGHRDAVIDGTIVDVKSASSFSFKKFKGGLKKEEDAFGYLPQLQSYLYAGQEDPIVTDKSRAAFLVVDKTLGHMALDIHGRSETDWPELFKQKKEIIASSEVPERGFVDEPFGQSGNKKLSVNCSYCAFNKTCWPGLRTFLYSYGPVHLTEINREPAVPELGGSFEKEEIS